jgi:hypothetical protein
VRWMFERCTFGPCARSDRPRNSRVINLHTRFEPSLYTCHRQRDMIAVEMLMPSHRYIACQHACSPPRRYSPNTTFHTLRTVLHVAKLALTRLLTRVTRSVALVDSLCTCCFLDSAVEASQSTTNSAASIAISWTTVLQVLTSCRH